MPELVNIELRDYQKHAVRQAIKIGYGVLDMPPRAGKTRTMAAIIHELALPTIWIAPTDRIVEQTVTVLGGFFGHNFATHLVGSGEQDKAAKSHIVVCTAATAGNLSAEFYRSREILVIDEYHHAAAKTYHHVFDNCEHVYHRYGMTGTFFRSGVDELALHAYLSDTVFRITSAELLAQGYLVPTHVAFFPVKSSKIRGLANTTYQMGHGKHGVQEHVDRNRMAAWAAIVLRSTGRQVLVLVGTKHQGRILQDLIAGLLENGAGPAPRGAARRRNSRIGEVEYVSTDVPRPRQREVVDAFSAGQVGVLIGTSLLGEGVDLPSADALVYARGEKAEVTLIQNAYRVSTAAHGKRYAIIVDFADRHHRKLLNHSLERLAVYHAEPTFTAAVLEDAYEFSTWVAGLGPFRDPG
jgi:superfamily II DNA or RNA helicase